MFLKKFVSFFFLGVLASLVGCSSRSFDRDYKVVDASHRKVPEWIVDVDVWAKEEQDDLKKYRYYTYTSEAANSRSISCEIAKAHVSSVIASEISQFIKDTFSANELLKVSFAIMNIVKSPSFDTFKI